MKTTIITGQMLKHMVINGAVNLKNNSKKIDDLNVFPVPDGDTGSNMSATMINGAKDARALNDNESIDRVAKTISRGLLMGARGNSGVILSQLFSGLYKGLKGNEEVNALQFANALVSGYEKAYQSVMNPVEGTILTVAKDAANYVAKIAYEGMDIREFFQEYIREVRLSLDRTPELLPVLKEVGVVDSGGAGYLEVVIGMVDYLDGKVYEEKNVSNTVANIGINMGMNPEEDFGYCTEFIMSLKNHESFVQEDFVERISKMGDSLVVVQDENILKVHVHTKTPGDVLNLAQLNGVFANIKIENMTLQHSEVVLHQTDKETGECTCGHEHGHTHHAPKKKYGLVAVVNGKGLKETFIEMGCDYIIEGGQTMNPSTEDFVKACEAVNAENVIIIPNNKNVMLSAETAAKIIEDKHVTVIPAKTIPQGYASLMMFDSTASLEDNVEEMTEHIKNVKTGEITYAIRETETNGLKINKDDFIGIFNGKIVNNNKERLDAVKALLDKIVNENDEIITIMYGVKVSEEELNEVLAYIEETFGVEVETIAGEQDIYSYIIAVE